MMASTHSFKHKAFGKKMCRGSTRIRISVSKCYDPNALLTQIGQWISTRPKLGSGACVKDRFHWTQIGQWILDPFWAVDTALKTGSTGPKLGSGYCVKHSVDISGFFCHSDFV